MLKISQHSIKNKLNYNKKYKNRVFLKNNKNQKELVEKFKRNNFEINKNHFNNFLNLFYKNKLKIIFNKLKF